MIDEYFKLKNEEFINDIYPSLTKEVQLLIDKVKFFKNCYEGTQRFLIIENKIYNYELPIK